MRSPSGSDHPVAIALVSFTLTLTLCACARTDHIAIPETVPELRPGLLQGYLTPQALPNSAALLPPPPAEGSAAAKERYDRPRPFEANGEPICTPEDEAALRGNGSYPSGHAAIGWGWG